MKEIVILGGPNGAGKTTAARVLLPSEKRILIVEKRQSVALTIHDEERWQVISETRR